MKRTGKTAARLKSRSGKSKSGFVYHKRDPEAMRKRAARQGARYDSPFKDGYDTYRPKQGDNAIRILPPTWEGADHYGLPIWLHKRVGSDNATYLCPLKMKSKKCPICEAAREAKDAGEQEEARSLEAKENYVYWILDRDGDDPLLPLLYTVSWTADRDIAALCEDKRSGKILFIDHPDDGYDLYFKRTGQKLNTRYTAHQLDRTATPICDDPTDQEDVLKIINDTPLPATLKYFDYDYLDKVLSGGASGSDEEEDEDEEEEDRDDRSTRRTRKSKDRDDEDEDESQDEDEDEKEERKPSRSARRTRGKNRDEDDDEGESKDQDEDESKDDDEDEERPRRGRVERVKSRKKKDDDDDETSDDDEETGDDDEEQTDDDEDEKEERTSRTRARRTRRR